MTFLNICLYIICLLFVIIVFNIIKESCSKVSSEVAASVGRQLYGNELYLRQRAAVGSSGQQWAGGITHDLLCWSSSWLWELPGCVTHSQSCTDCMLDWAAHPFSWAQLLLGDAMILKYIKHLRMKIFGRLDFTLVSWCINAVGYSL